MDEPAGTPAARMPDEVADLVQAHTRIFDVRAAEHRATRSSIPGSELLDVNERLAGGDMDVLLEAGLPRDETIVLVCNTGGKCGRAASFLRDNGYDAVAVAGGMQAWEARGLEVKPPSRLDGTGCGHAAQ